MLVISIFSFFHNVFYPSYNKFQIFIHIYFVLFTCFLFGLVQNVSFGKGLTLSLTTNFKLIQTERLCRQQFQIWQKRKKVIQTGRKRCGKRRNCLLQAISPFPTVFSKDLYSRHVKTRACFGKG